MYRVFITGCILVACWLALLTYETFGNKSNIQIIDRNVMEIKTRYAEYDAKLTELILKQDQRITLLENLMERDNAKR